MRCWHFLDLNFAQYLEVQKIICSKPGFAKKKTNCLS